MDESRAALEDPLFPSPVGKIEFSLQRHDFAIVCLAGLRGYPRRPLGTVEILGISMIKMFGRLAADVREGIVSCLSCEVGCGCQRASEKSKSLWRREIYNRQKYFLHVHVFVLRTSCYHESLIADDVTANHIASSNWTRQRAQSSSRNAKPR
jgi:hypothetical protein